MTSQSEADHDHKGFLRQLYGVAVDRVDPYKMIKKQLTVRGGLLETASASLQTVRIRLSDYDRILVLGAGKASAPMARALEELLEGEEHPPLEGLVSVKYGHGAATRHVGLIEAGHPVPDENSLRAGNEIAAMLETADEHCLLINLISGGGSALLVRPAPGLEYADVQAMNQVLLDCGAEIHEINTLRKHTSSIKGGRLAELAAPGHLLNIILSDVVGDNLEVIASGLAVPDPSTFGDVQEVISRYGLEQKLPRQIVDHFRRGLEDPAMETPKPGHPCFRQVQTVLLGNNRSALEAAANFAEQRGTQTLILSSRMSGEAREVAKVFAAMALDPPGTNLLILAGGETTVTMQGSGKGGRSQELALSYLDTILRSGLVPKACFLAAGSDGNDGPTDAAGAIISIEDIRQPAATLPDPTPWLAANNAYEYLSAQGLLYKTGPTNTNVCDFCFLYIPPASA